MCAGVPEGLQPCRTCGFSALMFPMLEQGRGGVLQQVTADLGPRQRSLTRSNFSPVTGCSTSRIPIAR